MRTKLLLAIVMLCLSSLALAEGGTCPPGMYPVGGPGAMGCAPIPGYESDDSEVFNAPSTRWAKTWGAIAIDSAQGKMGAVTGKMSKRDAQKAASSQCRANGGGVGCKNISLIYRNQCGVMAEGYGFAATQGAETIEIASKLALQNCSQQATGCRITYAACSEPVQVQ